MGTLNSNEGVKYNIVGKLRDENEKLKQHIAFLENGADLAKAQREAVEWKKIARERRDEVAGCKKLISELEDEVRSMVQERKEIDAKLDRIIGAFKGGKK